MILPSPWKMKGVFPLAVSFLLVVSLSSAGGASPILPEERGKGPSPEPIFGKEEASLLGKDRPFTEDLLPRIGPLGGEEFQRLLKVRDERVRFFIRYYQTRGKRFFKRWLERSGRYLPVIKRILREEGLPEDLAYLPLIESGFSPMAHSRSGAVGIWQFVEGTARRYGLRVDWWIDERRDIEKSTRAAAAYLRDLYRIFGSWPLALAAYNAGEGRVMRALRKYRGHDHWKILRKRIFKRETRNYVPKFIASLTIAKDPETYGFMDVRYRSPLVYDKVVLKGATDIKVIARAAGVSVREIKVLNPQLKRWFTPPDYPDYELKIPKGRKEVFLQYIARIPPSKRLEFYKHRVRKGETLISIARRYRTTVKAISYLNDIRNPRRIRAGSYIVVPVRAERHRKRVASVRGERVLYTVKEGDTLWEIARYFGVSLTLLYRINGLEEGRHIYPGDRLIIPLKEGRNLAVP